MLQSQEIIASIKKFDTKVELKVDQSKLFEVLDDIQRISTMIDKPGPYNKTQIHTASLPCNTYSNSVKYAPDVILDKNNKAYAVECSIKLCSSPQEILKTLQAERIRQDEQGLSDLFAKFCIFTNRYNSSRKIWMFYNGKRWEDDVGGLRVAEKVKLFYSEILKYGANEIQDLMAKNKFMKFVFALGSESKRKRIVTDAMDCFDVKDDDFDKNIFLFNCQNGVVDLRTGILKPHSPLDMLSKISNVIYDPNATSILLEKFINEIMCNDLILVEYLKRFLGYSISGCTNEECFFILYGPKTRNGKSTLISLVNYMLGESKSGYSKNMRVESLASKKFSSGSNASGDINRLKGARFVSASEPDQNMELNVALIKELTGGDMVTSRALYEAEIEYKPLFKLVINANHLPAIRDNTLITSNRVRIIPFNRYFAPHERNKRLKEMLQKDDVVSAFFNMCLAGFQDYYHKGSLDEPQYVQTIVTAYRPLEDIVEQFLKEKLVAANANIKAIDVYNAYLEYCRGASYSFVKKNVFYDFLRDKDLIVESATVNGNTYSNVLVGYELSSVT